MLVAYPVLVALAAAINVALGRYFEGHAPATWWELPYGPAVTLLVVWAALLIEVWVRQRLKSDK
jgi:hypothetical protein